MTLEQHYGIVRAAELLECHPETLRRAAAAGRLRFVRVGRDLRFPESALVEWLEANAGGQVLSLPDRASRRMGSPSKRRAS